MKKNGMKRILMWCMVFAITLGMLGSLNVSAEGAEQPEPFSAVVRIKKLTEGPLYFESSLELSAEVTEANRGFTIFWEMAQVKPDEELKWEQLAAGERLILVVTRSWNSCLYRAGAKAEDGQTVYSEAYRIPEPTEKAAEAPAEEQPAPAAEEVSPAAEAAPEAAPAEAPAAAEGEPAAEEVKQEEPAEETEPAADTPAEGSVTAAEPETEEPAPADESSEKPVPEEEPAEEAEPASETPAEETVPAAEPETEEPAPADDSSEKPVPGEEPAEETGETAEESVEEEPAVVSEPAEQEPMPRKTIEDYRELLESGSAAKAFTAGLTDVRLDPNGMSSIFTTLEGDTEVTVLEVAGDWICVLIGEDQIGYIYKDDLSGLPEESATGTEPAEEAEKTEEGEEPEDPEAPAETEGEPAAEDPAADLKVTIFTSRRTVMVEGEYVILSSKLEGFDDYSVLYQWECDKGEGFEKVEGADAEDYVFSADVESLSWSWRLVVYYR